MNQPNIQGLDPSSLELRRTGKKPRPPHWKRHLLRQIFGWSLIVLGVIMLIFPGPGWLTVGMGAVVLAPYVRIFHRFVEWLKRKFPVLRVPLERFAARHHHDHDQPTS
jgi:hypothetical protein